MNVNCYITKFFKRENYSVHAIHLYAKNHCLTDYYYASCDLGQKSGHEDLLMYVLFSIRAIKTMVQKIVRKSELHFLHEL